MMWLPQGWASAEIGELCDLINGRAFKPSDWTQTGLPIVRIQNLNNPEKPFNYFDGEVRDRFLIENGDLLFAWSGTPGTSFGAHVWMGGKAVLNQHIFNMKFDADNIDRDYFKSAINQKLNELIAKAHGGAGLQHVTKGRFEETEIPLPPLPEQRRIVRKLDTLSARSTTARTHLTAIEKLVERYKSGVTALAVSGALTESFRRLNSLPEPTVATFGEWFDYKGGSQPPKSTFYPEPAQGRIRMLQIRDFASDDKAVYIDDNGKWPRCSSDDIMVGRYGASVGKILSGKTGAYNVALVKWVFDRTAFDPAWIYALLKSDVFQRPIAAVSRSAQDGFNKGDVENIEFLKPSIKEQREIVRRIETAFAKIDRLKAEAAKALKLLGHLDQRILAKAFAGDLVPQDPTDEPAETLLARIREVRAVAPKGKMRRTVTTG